MRVTLDGKHCYISIPLGVNAVKGTDYAQRIVVLTSFLHAEKPRSFEPTELSRCKTIPS